MAESAVVTAPVLVVALDPWAERVAAHIARGTPDLVAVVCARDRHDCEAAVDGATSRQLALLVAGAEVAGHDSDRAQTCLTRTRAALEARSVTHLEVRNDGASVWVGPTVVPGRPGCAWCWQARCRQHAEALSGGPAPVAGDGRAARVEAAAGERLDSVSLAARAVRAVARRVLMAPEDEAGVVRRFGRDGGAPTIGRVIAVTGCARCDRRVPRPAGWSLHPVVTAGGPTTTR